MYGHTMMLKPQFGSTAFLHRGHDLLAGSQYAEFKMFFFFAEAGKTALQRLQMKTVQTAFI
jgi:hypothetical protein